MKKNTYIEPGTTVVDVEFNSAIAIGSGGELFEEPFE